MKVIAAASVRVTFGFARSSLGMHWTSAASVIVLHYSRCVAHHFAEPGFPCYSYYASMCLAPQRRVDSATAAELVGLPEVKDADLVPGRYEGADAR